MAPCIREPVVRRLNAFVLESLVDVMQRANTLIPARLHSAVHSRSRPDSQPYPTRCPFCSASYVKGYVNVHLPDVVRKRYAFPGALSSCISLQRTVHGIVEAASG